MRNNHVPAHMPASERPTISAGSGRVVTGAGFLPDHEVTIRITYPEQHVNDYVTYTTDTAGRLFAVISADIAAGASDIAVTDHRRDPDAPDGLLWSNTRTLHG